MANVHDVLIRPIVSEQTMDQIAEKKYSFEVPLSVNKIEVKKAVEQIFGVKVQKVTTMRVPGKMKRMGAHMGRQPAWKKAVVKLTEGSKGIEFFDGLI